MRIRAASKNHGGYQEGCEAQQTPDVSAYHAGEEGCDCQSGDANPSRTPASAPKSIPSEATLDANPRDAIRPPITTTTPKPAPHAPSWRCFFTRPARIKSDCARNQTNQLVRIIRARKDRLGSDNEERAEIERRNESGNNQQQHSRRHRGEEGASRGAPRTR